MILDVPHNDTYANGKALFVGFPSMICTLNVVLGAFVAEELDQ